MATRRFTSEKTANDFANKVNGNVKDLREFKDSKSNFKVEYTGQKGRTKEESLGSDLYKGNERRKPEERYVSYDEDYDDDWDDDDAPLDDSEGYTDQGDLQEMVNYWESL